MPAALCAPTVQSNSISVLSDSERFVFHPPLYVLQVLKEEKPSAVVVAFDAGNSFRCSAKAVVC
jgi:hypothetical protein